MTRIKICGLTRQCDIIAVNRAKPDYAGFVFAQSRRRVTEEQAAALKSILDGSIQSVGVFVNDEIDRIERIVRLGIIDMIQLHGCESEDYVHQTVERCKIPVIRAVTVKTAEDILRRQDTMADYLLLDNGKGGTGETFDWRLISSCSKPFFLAGGLNVINIEEAIRSTRPFAVDVSSGVETDGFKDEEKINEIVRLCNNA